MMRLGWLLLVAVALHGQPSAVPKPVALEKRLTRAITGSPLYRRSTLGIHVVELSSGRTLFARNMDRMFVPASNTKLVTTAAALTRLGPEHRLKTQLLTDASGNLILVGGGDPSLSSRVYPYVKDSEPLGALHALEEMVDQAVAAGLQRVDGDVIGDDTLYPWDPFPPSWTQDDALGEDGPPVSALTLNDNVIAIHVRPGAEAGSLAEVELSPAFEYFTIDNRVTTTFRGGTRVRFHRNPGSNQILLTGYISTGAERTLMAAVDDPALFAAHALYDVLSRRGIPIRGQAVARHNFEEEPATKPEGKLLAERLSPPMTEILQVIDKVSQNLHAEMLLREVGRVNRHEATRVAGIDELGAMLKSMGATEDDFRFEDGSGLSRNDLITPHALTTLLATMHQAKDGDTYQRDTWVGLLPVGGEDGTLSSRLCCSSDAHNIHAKTGTLARSLALSGYADSKSHGMLAFSIIVNNFAAGGAAVRGWIDRMALELVE